MFGPVQSPTGSRLLLACNGSAGPRPSVPRAGFTLMEVMIACGIFFMATFAILALVSTTLRNARALQRRDIDAGMAASQVYETLKTNRMEQGSMSGDFGEGYPGFSWEAVWDLDWDSGVTNGLLKVDIVVNRRGNRLPTDSLSIRVFAPDARSGQGQPNFR
jgi:type II secretion system protein I